MPFSKDADRQIIDHLPERATWDDIMCELYVKQKIVEGIRAADQGRSLPQKEPKRRLLADSG